MKKIPAWGLYVTHSHDSFCLFFKQRGFKMRSRSLCYERVLIDGSEVPLVRYFVNNAACGERKTATDQLIGGNHET